MIRLVSAALVWFAFTITAAAQDVVWIQIEAQPALSRAQDRARAYDIQLDNVAGYSLGGRWYGIVLGPYVRNDADTLLRQLKRSGQIPSDSFIALGRNFGQQFWPIGIGAQTTAQPLPETEQVVVAEQEPQANADVVVLEEPEIVTPDETPREARASESQLTRDERKDLQIALQWAGHYRSAIDGAFGRGTRSSMRAWQEANNHEPTGILTTAQRAELLTAYNAVLDGMDLQLVRDEATGIEMLVPSGVVEFSAYEPPFARFDPKGELDAQVLFISQSGDQDRLFGLYEILQTLEIVPLEGPRRRRNTSFELEGINGEIHSYTMARLQNGMIKGFSLIWPAGDDERRRRILSEMQQSFTPFGVTLDPALSSPNEEQAINLVAGLEVRKPRVSRTGFYVDDTGTVLTSSSVVDSCERLTIDVDHEAEVTQVDAARGIAALRPKARLSPLAVAKFQTAVPRLKSQVAVAGFPYGGVLVTPSLTFGTLADLRGLAGEETLKRLSLVAQPGDVGGPVYDDSGAVLGMLLPREVRDGQVLPADVSFTIGSNEILTFLQGAGVDAQTTDTMAFMPKGALTLQAADTAVLVSCW